MKITDLRILVHERKMPAEEHGLSSCMQERFTMRKTPPETLRLFIS
jgi:hypothetical protein